MIGSTNVRKLKKGELLFGDGSDGDLVVPANTTMEWDVKEDIGRIYKQYNTLTLEEGSTLKPKHRCNGAIILVKGDCIIRGHLSMDGCAPLLNDYENETLNDRHVKLAGALKGGNGGKGGAGYWILSTNEFSAPTDADRISNFGGIGGNGHRLGGGFGGGGGGGERYKSQFAGYMPEYEYKGGASEPRPSFGITWPCTTNGAYGAGGGSYGDYNNSSSFHANGTVKGGAAPGGSGGSLGGSAFVEGGGLFYGYSGAAGRAYGGGALWLYVGGCVIIEQTGEITANGGVGALIGMKNDRTGQSRITDCDAFGGCGGSGGGGIIFICFGAQTNTHYLGYVNDGTVAASGAPLVNFTGVIRNITGSSSGTYNELCPLGFGEAGNTGTVTIKRLSSLKEVL